MKNKKIIIAGGSGFIGEEMIRYFGKENTIVILTRQLPNRAITEINIPVLQVMSFQTQRSFSGMEKQLAPG